MDSKKVGISLRNYIYKEGYTKKSFSKFMNIDYSDLDSIINNRFIDKDRYNELLEKILNKINLNKDDLVEKYFNENIREKQIEIIKENKDNVFKLDIEQREILIDLLEYEILKKEHKRKEYELPEEKPWRIQDLDIEIKKLQDIVLILKNIVTIIK